MSSLVRSALRGIGFRKSRVEAARLYLERQLLARRSPRRVGSAGRILCYHSVGQPHLGVNDVSPARFREQLELALALGYRFVSPTRIADGGGSAKELAVTFDDAYVSVMNAAQPVLKELGIPYTVFVVSSWADGVHLLPESVMNWKQLQSLLARGDVQIGSHSKTHPDFAALGTEALIEELALSRATIEERLGVPVTDFAIPFGQSKNWTPAASAAASQTGYRLLYAQAVNTRPPGTVPRTFVTRADDARLFAALLAGAYDDWEEWLWS